LRTFCVRNVLNSASALNRDFRGLPEVPGGASYVLNHNTWRPKRPPRLGAAGTGASMRCVFICMRNLPWPPEGPGRLDESRSNIHQHCITIGTGGYSGDFTASESGFRAPQKSGHQKCHETCPELSSGAEKTTKLHSKTSPMQLEGSRGPNSDPKNPDCWSGTCL
jgi:hypothetical protein